jgi:hypothetical protein
VKISKKNEMEVKYRKKSIEPEHDMLLMEKRTSRWENIEDHCIEFHQGKKRYSQTPSTKQRNFIGELNRIELTSIK